MVVTKEQLIAMLDELPPGTEVFVRHGSAYDDAYTPRLRAYQYGGKISAYIEIADHGREHRNYPEHYSGVTEVPLKGLK